MRPVLVRFLLVISVAALPACAGSAHPRATSTAVTGAVEAAIPSLERARAASTQSLDLLLQTAAVIDEKDADGAAGDRTAMQQHARAHPLDSATVRATGVGLSSGAASYAQAVEVLADAAQRSQLSAAQESALDGVVRAARTEAAACAALAKVAESSWASYRSLAQLQSKWLTRARAGWYRDRKEGADAYAVLTSGVRPTVTAARPKLAAAANERAAAAELYASAVRALRVSIGPSSP